MKLGARCFFTDFEVKSMKSMKSMKKYEKERKI